MTNAGTENAEAFNSLASGYGDGAERNVQEWTEFWDEYAELDLLITGLPARPLETVRANEEDQNELLDGYRESLKSQDVFGFLVAASYPNARVRREAAYRTSEVWDIDKDLARAAFRLLALDEDDGVRIDAISGMMIMLYGEGIHFSGDQKDLTPGEAEGLHDILAHSITAINESAQLSPGAS